MMTKRAANPKVKVPSDWVFAHVDNPLRWPDPVQMGEAIDCYFEETPSPHSLTELALYLGFACRESLWHYGQRAAFKDLMQYAKSRIEVEYIKYGFMEKNFTFADRMLTRLGYPCVEKSENDTNVRIQPPEIK
jgi:hypothetical protein